MYKHLLLILTLFFLSNETDAQVTAKDTSDYPYWIEMMQDPSINFYKTQRAFEIYWANRPIEKGSGYKPFKRWEYNMLEIIDSVGNIPAPGVLEKEVQNYINTYKSARYPGGTAGLLTGAPCLTNGNWVELGPKNMPTNKTGQPNGLGRINALAFHPTDSNKLYAGAPAGGLWLSTNGGQSWSSTTDTLVTLGISSIAIDPQKPDTIYIGTGDRDASDSYGKGVLKSIDGGITWTSANSGMGNVVVGRLIIDPSNTQILLAATSSGIYRSTNGATSWTKIISGNYKEIVFSAKNSQVVFASTGASFYKSTNNGSSWTKISSGLPSGKSRMVIGVTPADTNFVYSLITNSSTYAGLYLSTDQGNSFQLMSDTPNIMDYSHLGTGTGGQAWYDLDIAVDPNDKSIIYSAGVNIFQSIDSGKTWKISAHWVGNGGASDVHADNHILEFQPKTNTLYTGNDGGVYYTKDVGKTWTEISDGLGIAQIYRLGQSALNPDLLINGYQDNGTGIYVNGTWYTITGGDGMDCLIDPTDDTWAYSDLYYGDIRRYKNNAYNAIIAKNGTNGINETGGWITPFILREGNSNTMFAGYKNVWRTTNVKAASASSISWDKISSNLGGSDGKNITVLENSSVDDDLLYMARSDNKFFKTENANATTPNWTDLSSSLPNTAGIQWVETHRKFRDRVWICQSNNVYQSNDGGSNWTDISSGLPNIPMMCITFDSSSAYQGMYVGTYMGVFYKDTTMSSWIWYNDKMPVNTRVRDIEIYYSPSGRDKSHVVCATYGRGNWRSPLYDEDQNKPIAGFKTDKKQICLNEVLTLKDTSSNIPTRWQWDISPKSITFLNSTDSFSQNPVVKFNAKGKYTIKFWAANCNGIDSITKVNYIEVFDAITAAQCTGFTKTIGSYGIGIYGVDVSTTSHTSVGPNVEGGYVNRACTDIIYVKTDTAYFATITTGKTYNEYVKVFIDFNNNGSMNDAGEMVFNTPKGKTTHQDSIRIPVNPVTNTLLRMRVMSDYDTVKSNSCDTMHYGQTEDFGLVIESRVPTPHLYIDTNRICKNEEIVLRDTSEGSIYKKRWYVSQYGLVTYKKDGDGPMKFTLPDTGWYYALLVLNDSIISQRIDSIVYVKPIPASSLTVSAGSSNGCEGDNLELFNGGQPTGVVLNKWFKNGLEISGETANTLSKNNLTIGDTGTYMSEVEWNGCIATSNNIKINVTPGPKADFTPDKVEACFLNNKFTFTNTSTLSSGAISYNWSFGQGSNSTAKNPSFSYSDTGSYTVSLIASSSGGCKDTIEKTISIWPSAMAGFTIDQKNQCLKNNNFTLTNSSTIDAGSLTYHWNFGDLSTASTQDEQHSYAKDGNFDIRLIAISDKNCSDTLVQTVIVYPSPNTDFNVVPIEACGANNQFDFNDNSTISSGSINNHKWIFGDGSNSVLKDELKKNLNGIGTFVVRKISISADGCADTSSQSVVINQKPLAQFTINNKQQCFNWHAFSFTNSSSISIGSIVASSWTFGDGNSSTAATPPNYTYFSDGNYSIRLIVVSDQGCSDTSSALVDVFPNPKVSFSGGSGCVGDILSFLNSTTIAQGTVASYGWNLGDGNTSTDINPVHVYGKDGTYEIKLIAVSDKGCFDSLVNKNGADIFIKPVADFNYSKIWASGLSTEITFKDNSSNAVNWMWSMDNGQASSDQNPTATYADSGTYQIQLIVTSVEGCQDTLNRSIFVFPDNAFHLANTFTPNGDGLNELLRPYGLGYLKEYKMDVYNRWGVKVFETTNPQMGWDGIYMDKIAEDGIYLVTITYTDLENVKQRFDMTVRLLR